MAEKQNKIYKVVWRYLHRRGREEVTFTSTSDAIMSFIELRKCVHLIEWVCVYDGDEESADHWWVNPHGE